MTKGSNTGFTYIKQALCHFTDQMSIDIILNNSKVGLLKLTQINNPFNFNAIFVLFKNFLRKSATSDTEAVAPRSQLSHRVDKLELTVADLSNTTIGSYQVCYMTTYSINLTRNTSFLFFKYHLNQ